jgi:hypothetical protein
LPGDTARATVPDLPVTRLTDLLASGVEKTP